MLNFVKELFEKEESGRFIVGKEKSFGYMIKPKTKLGEFERKTIEAFNFQLSKFKGKKQKKLAKEMISQLENVKW